jgi:hypothetical protein
MDHFPLDYAISFAYLPILSNPGHAALYPSEVQVKTPAIGRLVSRTIQSTNGALLQSHAARRRSCRADAETSDETQPAKPRS